MITKSLLYRIFGLRAATCHRSKQNFKSGSTAPSQTEAQSEKLPCRIVLLPGALLPALLVASLELEILV